MSAASLMPLGGRSVEISPRINKSARVPYHSMEAASLHATTEGGLCAAGVPLHHAKWTPGSSTCTPTHRPSAHSLARLPRELGGHEDDEEAGGPPRHGTLMGPTGRGTPPPAATPDLLGAVGALMIGDPAQGSEASAQADLSMSRAERRCAQLREANCRQIPFYLFLSHIY